MANAGARGVLGTRVWPTHGLTRLTGEVALLVLATVLVCPALHIDTRHQGVTPETSGAHTLGRVELNNTLSSAAAGPVRVEARVEAVLIDAGLVDRAVIVGATLRSSTDCRGRPRSPGDRCTLGGARAWCTGPGARMGC